MTQIGYLRNTFDVARWLSLQGSASYGWGALVRTNRYTENSLKDLNEELHVQLAKQLRVIDANGLTLDELSALLREPRHDIVMVKGLEGWNAEALETLDVNRSALARPGFVLLLLTSDALRRLFQYAPNLRSWIGGQILSLDPDIGVMTSEERRARLNALSSHYSLSDDEVVALAQSGKLSPDPEFAEWLILLGRPDLVG